MQEAFSDHKNKWLYIFIGLAALLNFSGLFITIMGPDAALYASISRTMAEHNDFVNLYAQGTDWLDKPHFPFWVTAVFFKVFGVTTWAYKLPGILFHLLAAFFTYKLAKDLYNKQIALWSVLFLLTAEHIVINSMDVRAEPFLTGLIMASVYYFHKSLGRGWFLYILLASIFAACAVMTKGIFALIPIGGAVAGELLIKKNWAMVFSLRWIVAVIFILLFIIPELYTLYAQFDLHPEKIIFGRTGVSGIKFFFWDSQFGRFFNTGPIKKANGDITFFLHTILWAYLPWSLLFYTAIYQFFRKNFKQPLKAEWYAISGTLLTLLVFSVSKFQLPFYIAIVFPFFSILCAQYIYHIQQVDSVKIIRTVQWVVCGIMLLLIGLIQYFFRPDGTYISGIWLLLVPVLVFIIVSIAKDTGRFKIFYQVCCVVFFVNLYLTLAYFPNVLKYQADSEAAFWINAHNKEHLPVVQPRFIFGYPFAFYSLASVHCFREGEERLLPKKPYLLYGEKTFIDAMEAGGYKINRLKNFSYFRITKVTGKFLNHNTREQVLTTNQVVLID
ncbi:ArnT family glycosyltransferase [Pedobacter sp. MR2016-24]|uniref:ArnT family glycosyltransferase n=1 Tax=Pedobacter sp. MR2016-24 TaxID=2994466 RepID=UPI002247E81C|nr:glycosyltransferase family 39 protein [Pedobacter sp. MR2016-24]MCX2485425.1 glycosyltransferase family 39 protein [Pedobacter sp. MR2016-24]